MTTQMTDSDSSEELFAARRAYSDSRLEQLVGRLANQAPLRAYPGLAIYVAGSYARGEASEHSDVDLFFIHNDCVGRVEDPHLKGIRVLSAVIREIEEGMDFPPPSNDGQFFNILTLSEVHRHLGGAEDDYKNHFTARMLLLLESLPVFGVSEYEHAIASMIESYLRDYEDHAVDFRTTFFANDIIRFWKTLCLNYEHRRNQLEDAKKIKQKIKNFKLKFSRLMTCFATVALLSSCNTNSKEELIAMCKMRPIDRLMKVRFHHPDAGPLVKSALDEYAWFLQKTRLSTGDLEHFFAAKANREEAFARADGFGRHMFEIVRLAADSTGTLRYLVM